MRVRARARVVSQAFKKQLALRLFTKTKNNQRQDESRDIKQQLTKGNGPGGGEG